MIDAPSSAPSAPTFLDPSSRRRAVQLRYPMAMDGREYRTIFIARPTAAEIAVWAESLDAKDPADRKRLKLYVDENGEEIPGAVIDSLDPDDDEEVGTASKDFLPRRLRAILYPEPSPDVSSPITGDITAP